MRRARYDEPHRQSPGGLAVKTSATSNLDVRRERLREALEETARLAAAGALPDIELNEKGFKFTPMDNATLAEAEVRVILRRNPGGAPM